MKKVVLLLGVLLLALGGGALAMGLAQPNRQSDCCGTIVCPLTGEEICPCACPLAE